VRPVVTVAYYLSAFTLFQSCRAVKSYAKMARVVFNLLKVHLTSRSFIMIVNMLRSRTEELASGLQQSLTILPDKRNSFDCLVGRKKKTVEEWLMQEPFRRWQ